jgi:hypothetical protein
MPSMLGHVQLLKTSAEVWEALDWTFASRSNMSMSNYYNRTKWIADAIAAIGVPLGDNEIVSYFLAGLGND